MPCLKILTNLPKNKIPADFVDKIIPTLSNAVKKAPEKFSCVIVGDCQMVLACDSKTPGIIGSLHSIGNLGPEENKFITKELSKFIEKELGVSPKRFFLTFHDTEAYNIGIAGTTVQDAGL